MTELWRVLRDPRVSINLILGLVCLAGLAALTAGWRGVAATVFVPTQVPFLLSGSVGGLAVIGAGLALLAVHLQRVEAAQEREAYAALQRDALRLLAVAPAARTALAARRAAARGRTPLPPLPSRRTVRLRSARTGS